MNFMQIGVCGLSCRLCPAYHRETKSQCKGCKSEYRMGAPCLFHNCAVKKKGIEYCGYCSEKDTCARWKKHREAGRQHDSSTSYQKLEDNISYIQKNGMEKFEDLQKSREKLLKAFLTEFNEGRSKTLYCTAATVLEIGELEDVLQKARADSKELDIKTKSEIMHTLLNEIAQNRGYSLKLRK